MYIVKDLLEKDAVKTDSTKKLSLRGELKNLPVYKIPIDKLFYNSQNDRIATWISKYEADYGNINDLDTEKYNDIIEKYIIKSNPDAYKKTKNNINAFGQREPGVVLKDGRIIDGNRRFTCLRELYNETKSNKQFYFEAVILDGEISSREIKILELEIQHGHEEKIDYNPIEKLVGIYYDVVKNKILTAEEYAKSIDIKISEMNKSIKKVELLVDFLDYINASEQFYIARELEIDGPLGEIYNIKQRLENDDDKWERARIVLYDTVLMKPTGDQTGGDITRTIRKIGNDVVHSDMFEDCFKNHIPISEEINNIIQDSDLLNTEYIRKNIRENEPLKKKMSNNIDDAIYEAKKVKVRSIPLEMIESVKDDISKIDLIAVSKLNSEDKNKFIEELTKLKKQLDIIEEKVNETL